MIFWVKLALTLVHPYRFGGTTRSGIDCSAFVLNVFGQSTGIELPRVAAENKQN